MSWSFNGSSIYGASATGIAASTFNNVGMTLLIWFKHSSQAAQFMPCSTANDNSGNSMQNYILVRTNGTVQCFIQDSHGIQNFATSTSTVNINAWNNVVITSNCHIGGTALGVNKGYVNGAGFDLSHGAAWAGWDKSMDYLAIGGRAITNGTFSSYEMTGLATWFAIWSRELTQAEVTTLQTADPSTVQPGSLLRLWKPDVAVDAQGSGQTLSNKKGTVTTSGDNPPPYAATGDVLDSTSMAGNMQEMSGGMSE